MDYDLVVRTDLPGYFRYCGAQNYIFGRYDRTARATPNLFAQQFLLEIAPQNEFLGYRARGLLEFKRIGPPDIKSILSKSDSKLNKTKVSSKWYNFCVINKLRIYSQLVLGNNKHLKKGRAYETLHHWLGEGLLTSTGAKWQTRRKILTPAFHFNILQQFLGIFHEETDNLISELEKTNNKDGINLIPLISQFALSTINETSMGTKLNVDNKEEYQYKNAIYTLGRLVVHRLTRPWLHDSFVYYYLTQNGHEERKYVKILHKFSNNVIRNRAKNFKNIELPSENTTQENYCYSIRKRLALLDILLNAKINEGKLDDQGIREEVDTFMFEGHDTVSISLCFSLMVLASHRQTQDQIYEEINKVLGVSTTTKPTYNDLQNLKFLERCIKECMRLYPAVSYISRELAEEITTKSGYILPSGTDIVIFIFDMHRNPNVFPDPQKFDPDRFLPENVKHRHPYAYLPFSAGPRNCIGQRFALLEMKTVLCAILKKFILEPVDTPETVVLKSELVLRPKGPIRVKFVPRHT